MMKNRIIATGFMAYGEGKSKTGREWPGMPGCREGADPL
jgi:hypothetical protein